MLKNVQPEIMNNGNTLDITLNEGAWLQAFPTEQGIPAIMGEITAEAFNGEATGKQGYTIDSLMLAAAPISAFQKKLKVKEIYTKEPEEADNIGCRVVLEGADGYEFNLHISWTYFNKHVLMLSLEPRVSQSVGCGYFLKVNKKPSYLNLCLECANELVEQIQNLHLEY